MLLPQATIEATLPTAQPESEDVTFMEYAIKEAQQGAEEGGVFSTS